MQWATLLAVVIEFLGPILRDWLANLLKRAADEIDEVEGPFPVGFVGDGSGVEAYLWDRAEQILDREAKSLAWYQWIAKWRLSSRRRYLEAARSVAVSRAGEFYARAVNGTRVVAMSPVEIERVESVE
jgi:hypothetical protein